MSYNGAGTFLINSAGQPVVAGTTISETVFNALTADLATGLSTAITKDGQTTATANLPMGGFKLTNLAAGTAATDSARLGQVQSGAATLIAITGTDTVVGTLTPTLTAYAAGQQFSFVAAATNTTSMTLNIDGLGAKAITRSGATALIAGDITVGKMITVIYDGTQFQTSDALVPLATGVTGTLPVANGGTGVTTSTGSGNNVLSTSPTLTGTMTTAAITATGLITSAAITATGLITSSASSASVLSGWSLTPTGTAAFGPGNVGYGFLANGTNMLAANFFASSDERLKIDIQGIPPLDALMWLKRSRPVTYRKKGLWNDADETAITEAGFLAQDQVRAGYGRYIGTGPHEGMPEKIDENGDRWSADVMLTMPPGYQIAYLTAALQIALERIEALESATQP